MDPGLLRLGMVADTCFGNKLAESNPPFSRCHKLAPLVVAHTRSQEDIAHGPHPWKLRQENRCKPQPTRRRALRGKSNGKPSARNIDFDLVKRVHLDRIKFEPIRLTLLA